MSTPGVGGGAAQPVLGRTWAGISGADALGVGELALGGLEDAGAVLVAALVGADLLGALVVALGQDGLHLGGGQLVIAGPRLVAAQRVDAAEDGAAVLVAALVRVDLAQVDLGQVGQPAYDLVRGELVVAGDRQVALGRHGALE